LQLKDFIYDDPSSETEGERGNCAYGVDEDGDGHSQPERADVIPLKAQEIGRTLGLGSRVKIEAPPRRQLNSAAAFDRRLKRVPISSHGLYLS
jgi:hypothetical protein